MRRPAPSLTSKRRIEPLVWLMFSGGGVTAAVLMPVLAFLFALAIPLGLVARPEFEHLHAVATHPVTLLALFGAFVIMLVHSAHRFRYTLYDGLQIKQKVLTAVLCYGGALIGAFAALKVFIYLI